MQGGARYLFASLLLAWTATAGAQQPSTAPAAPAPVATGGAGDGAARVEFTQRDLQNQAGLLVQDLKKTVDGLTPLIRAADQRHDEPEFYRLSQCQYQQTLLLMVVGEAYNKLYALPPSLLTSHPPTPEELARDPFLGSGRNPEADRNFGQALAYSTVIANTSAMSRELGATCSGRLHEVHIVGLP